MRIHSRCAALVTRIDQRLYYSLLKHACLVLGKNMMNPLRRGLGISAKKFLVTIAVCIELQMPSCACVDFTKM